MKIKKIITSILVVMIVLSLAACGNSSKTVLNTTTAASATGTAAQATTAETATSGKLFDQPTTIKMVTSSHPSYPYNNDWFVWKAITEATNVKLDVSAYSSEEYNDKTQLIMASGELPDFMYLSIAASNKYALDGPFINVMDNLDKAPNFKNWYDSSENSKQILKTYTSSDGNVYIFPLVGTEVTMNKMGWLARLDILKKHNLSVPNTYDELYTVLKELKKLYPDSYPLCFRDFFDKSGRGLELFATQWGTSTDAYYDFNKQEWRYGPIEDNFKELLKYFKKIYTDGLVAPDMLTMVAKGWTDLMSSNRSFFTTDYAVRIDYFNNPMREQNPDANLDLISPPKGNVPSGQSLISRTSYAGGGDCVCNKKGYETALKFVDWMYSDEGRELLAWGKEGETYKTVDGKRQFITDEKKSTKEVLYGLSTFGINQRGDPDAITMAFTKQTLDALYKTDDYMTDEYNPKLWMDFTKEEKDVKLGIEESIRTNMQEHVSKFITGELDIDTQWNTYVEGIKQIGIDKYLEVFTSAYERVK